jgi:hypothetical protein
MHLTPTSDGTPAPRRRFDRDTWNRLSGIDARLLDALAYLSRLSAERSPTRARYCTPGRKWLGQHLACSVETITRHTSKLAALGLLRKTQRRPVRGTWQTNLYVLHHPMAWAMGKLRAQLLAVSHRLSQMPRIAPSADRRRTDQRQKESLHDIIRRGLTRFGPQPA